MQRILWKFIAVPIVSLCLIGCQAASLGEPPTSSAMPPGSPTAPPVNYVAFCFRNPALCRKDESSVAIIHLDKTAWALIKSVNAKVNWSIRPESDMDHYGKSEYWTIPTDGYGDCEDYALTKREALIEAGLPQSALRIAIIQPPQGGRHVVLTLTTDKGDYVLDNLSADILPWDQLSYIWLERADESVSSGWVSLQPEDLSPIARMTTAMAK